MKCGLIVVLGASTCFESSPVGMSAESDVQQKAHVEARAEPRGLFLEEEDVRGVSGGDHSRA